MKRSSNILENIICTKETDLLYMQRCTVADHVECVGGNFRSLLFDICFTKFANVHTLHSIIYYMLFAPPHLLCLLSVINI